ncbi:tubulin folding cofactor C [Tieghemostelium lacteum]|uniref:Tubulin folding cofactor C n=1 Tax=Tieghemostelium lacteum TaxID=361077 RepID=A0A151ZJX1_TIELA|nr:tubulin folding cofactor C [Tieghemostelium lacteum]|eukprot:KYQ94246.1 tubulin folding cofactor C [Tieghemostelium lacteum]
MKNYLKKLKNDQKEVDLSNTENVTLIVGEFAKSIKEIESDLEKCRLITDKDIIQNQFKTINDKLHGVNSLLAESSSFLPLYEVKNTQESINKLTKSINTLKDQLLPKQKFTFKRNATTTTTTNTNTDIKPKQIDDTKKLQPNEQLESIFNIQEIRRIKSKNLNYPTDLKEESSVENLNNDLVMSSLDDCKITIKKPLNALKLDGLNDCVIKSLSPINGSIFIDNCSNCTFILASRQIRIHETKNSIFYIYTKSNPIVEGCQGIRFSYYPSEIVHDLQEFNDTTFTLQDKESNRYQQVHDFDWLQSTQSPNWSILPEDQRKFE